MKKIYLLFLSMILVLASSAQTVSIEVDAIEGNITGGSTGNNCGGSDCGGSQPDPRITFQVKHSGTGTWSGNYTANCDNIACNGSAFGCGFSGGNYTASNITSSNTINVQLTGNESDNVASGGVDGNCGTIGAPNAGSNNITITSGITTPCTWSGVYVSNRNGCSSDGATQNWGARWNYQWSWYGPSLTNANAGGTIAFSAAADNQMCDGGNPSIFNSSAGGLAGVSYQWQISSDNGANFSDIAAATAATYDHGALSVVGGVTTYYQFRRKATYCTSVAGGAATTTVYSNALAIEVRPDPNAPSATQSPGATVCSGQAISLTSPAYGSLPGWQCGFEYSIDGGAYSATASLASPSVGSHTIAIRAISNCKNGCGASPATTYTFTVIADPTISISGQTDVCVGGTATLTGTPSGGLGPFTYSWTRNAAAVGTNSATYTTDAALGAGSYAYIVSINNSIGCNATSSTVNANVVADPSITAQPTTTQSVCTGASPVGISITATGGTPSLTYQWYSNTTNSNAGGTLIGGAISNSYSPPSSGTAGTTYYYCVVSASGSGCGSVASNTSAVVVVATPSGGTIATTNYCSSTGSSSVSISGVSNATNYVWSLPAGLTGSSTTSSITVSGTAAGTYTVTATPRNIASGVTCTGTPVTGTVNIVANPTGGTIATVNYCSNTGSGSVSISGVSNATDYVWSLPAGLTGSSTTNSITVSGTAVGTYTVTATPRNIAFGITCTGTAVTGVVNIQALPVPSASSNSPVCVGNSLTLSSSATGGGGSYSYSWSGPSSYSSTSQNPTVSSSATAAMAGTYTVTVTDANTCSASTTTAVVVNPLPVDQTVGVSTASICVGGSSNITLASSESGINYQLRDNATNALVGSAVAGTGSAINLPVTPTVTTTYNVLATNATTTCFKQMPLTATVTVVSDPTNVASSDNSGCGSVNSSVAAALTGGLGGTYQWQLNSGAGYADIAGATSSSYNYNLTTPGVYKYKVIYTATGAGCDNHTSNEVTVTLNALPSPSLSLDKCAMSGGATGYEVIIATIPTANTTPNYIYTLPAGVTEIWSDATGANKIFKQPMGGSSLVYNVVDNNGTGCAGSAGITASVNEPVDIPLTGGSGSKTADCNQRGFGSVWEHYKDVSNSNNVLVSVKDNGVDLGTVSVISYVDATTPSYTRSCQGATYPYYAMKRHFKITSSNYPNGAALPSAVGVRLYFTQTEATALSTASLALNADGCEDDDDFKNPTTLSDLYVTKYTGSSEDGDYDNNNFTSGLFRVYGPAGADGRINYFPASFTSAFTGASAPHHYIEFDVTEFSEFWLHGAEHGTGLPVKYLYFTARPIENSYIKLDWATASEIDNRGFEIERSEDGMNFTRIGWVDGNGNSTVTHTYSFDDKTALYDVTYYYRLKQIDNSGRSEYSPLASAKIISGDRYTVSEFIPNKVETTSHLNIFTTNDRIVEIEVFNALGQKVNTVKRQLQKGNNTIEFDFSHLASGTYSASIRSNGEFMARKFLMVR